MLLVRPLIGKMIDRIGAKIVVIISIVISLVGTIPFTWFDQHTSYWMIVNQLKVTTPDVSHLASAYQAGFLTASILMVIMIVPSLFLMLPRLLRSSKKKMAYNLVSEIVRHLIALHSVSSCSFLKVFMSNTEICRPFSFLFH
ncbi:hypothetical protein [Paenibacillus qinlingensis]|uniref:Major facilitator superfamily (MFS) profile domain-containing protein n=1 Tax=Paenibacillus qinlingensis TaxID=1837343 RepID=A0ABU1NZW3_9BACL|nr:hypothetical protein [Paenibacillus qinlingensis]MDR6552382.1 hypothetical protein [Paenibacillus qinlingensis]